MNQKAISLASVLFATLAACADDAGSAPTIRDVSISPSVVSSNMTTTCIISGYATDRDRDLRGATVRIEREGVEQATYRATFSEVARTDDAPFNLSIAIAAGTSVGQYVLHVALDDEQGHVSNVESVTLTVQ